MWVIPQPAQAKPKQSIVNKQVSIATLIVNTPKQSQLNVSNKPSAQPPKNSLRNSRKSIRGVPAAQKVSLYSGRHYSKEEVENLIRTYSDLYGISSDTPHCIAFHESGYNQTSANKRSSAKGVFQYLDRTWKASDEGKAGYSVFDAEVNIKAAVKYMAIHKSTKPWTTRTSCPPLKFNH